MKDGVLLLYDKHDFAEKDDLNVMLDAAVTGYENQRAAALALARPDGPEPAAQAVTYTLGTLPPPLAKAPSLSITLSVASVGLETSLWVSCGGPALMLRTDLAHEHRPMMMFPGRPTDEFLRDVRAHALTLTVDTPPGFLKADRLDLQMRKFPTRKGMGADRSRSHFFLLDAWVRPGR